MLGQCVVSTPFTWAIAETGESPNSACEKTQTWQVAKAILFSGNPVPPCPNLAGLLKMWWKQEEEQLQHGTYLFLERKNMKSYFLQFPKCKSIEWYCSIVRFGKIIHIILHFSEGRCMTQVIRIKLSLCVFFFLCVHLCPEAFTQLLVHISLPFHSSAQDNKKKEDE